MKRILITCLLLGIFLTPSLHAQVNKAKENAKNYKNNDSNSERGESNGDSFDSGGGGGCVGAFFVDILFQGIGAAHMHMLDRRFDEPWIVSLESQLTSAIDPSTGTVSFTPSVRGNWGLFSTQLRTNRLFDGTGTLQTLDWQILQLNFMSQEHVNLRYGVGISYEFVTEQAHFEQYFGLQLHFAERRINPEVNLRMSDSYGDARTELNVLMDWKFASNNVIETGLILGYSYQNWYNNPENPSKFHMIMTGLSFRIE